MKKIFYLPAVFILASLASCNNPGKQPASERASASETKVADMKARYTMLNEFFSTGKGGAIDTIVAADVVDHESDTTMHLPKGRKGLKKMVAMWREGSPDMKVDVKYMAVDGDILMAYGTISGTNTGKSMDMEPTNKHWSADFADVVKFDSKMQMVEHWGVFDSMKMMKDMGMKMVPGIPAHTNMEKKGEMEKK